MPDLEVYDGFSSLQGGMNGGIVPSLIPDSQYAKGVNVTCRNGRIGTRPHFTEILFDTEIEGAIENLQNGKFQGMTFYQHQSTGYIIFAFSGVVYLLNPLTGSMFDMNTTERFNQYVDRLHFCQVEQFMIVQDGFNAALIIEGTGSRKAVLADDEIPIGTTMAYCQGRIFLKTDNNEFLAGDINQAGTPGAVLLFTESDYLAGGGAFYTPADMGNIVGMTWTQQFNTPTGQGPLLVLCERGICSYDVSISRTEWQDTSIMRIEPSGNGCASEFCITKMNEDLLFMSWNGIQDFALINVEVNSQHRITNLNTEVLPFLKQETTWLLPYTHGARFDDRFLYTAVGEAVPAYDRDGDEVEDYRFKGLVALDFAPTNGLSSLGQGVRPAYDGIWTGMHPMGIASGIFEYEERCYVWGKDNDNANHLYELHKIQGYDKGNVPIECKLYSRAMPFIAYDKDYPRPVPAFQKELFDASLWISEFEESVSVVLGVNNDNGLNFTGISTISINAPMHESVMPFDGGYRQSRPKERFPAFSETACDPISGRSMLLGFYMQFSLVWSGIVNIDQFMVSAKAHREVLDMECGDNTKILFGPPPDDFSYDMEEAS